MVFDAMAQAKAARWWGRRQAMAKWRWGLSEGRTSGHPGDPRAIGAGTLGTQGRRPWLGLKRHLAMDWLRRLQCAALACGMA